MPTEKRKSEKQIASSREDAITKEDFLKALKKATRPIQKPSRGKGKRKTSE